MDLNSSLQITQEINYPNNTDKKSKINPCKIGTYLYNTIFDLSQMRR